MYTAWSRATRYRPSVSPATIVHDEVGVASIRRETPSCLVATSRPAAETEVRKMNRTSWVVAPRVNRENPSKKPASPDSVTDTSTPGTVS